MTKLKFLIGFIAIQSFLIGRADNVMPLRVDKITMTGGYQTKRYVIVHTTLKLNPKSTIGADKDVKPIISRATINGPLGIGKDVGIGVALQAPQQLTDFEKDWGVNIGDCAHLLSQSIGSIGAAIPDPETKAALEGTALAIDTAGVLTDVGLRITGKLLDKAFNKSPITLEVIEILPEGYYTVDPSSGTVTPTPQFTKDEEKFKELQAELAEKLETYYKTFWEPYDYAWAKWRHDDPVEHNENMMKELDTMAKAMSEPRKEIFTLQAQLAALPLWRLAIMGFGLGAENSVGCDTAKSMRLLVYLGSHQTNAYDIPYCVGNKNNPKVIIEMVSPALADSTGFSEPGIRFACPDQSISFQDMRDDVLSYGFVNSRIYNWFDEMVVGKDEEGLDPFLLPYSILQLQNDVDADIKKAEKAGKTAEVTKLTDLKDDLSKAVTKIKEAKEAKQKVIDKEKGKIEAGFEAETTRLIKAAQDSNTEVSKNISTTKQEIQDAKNLAGAAPEKANIARARLALVRADTAFEDAELGLAELTTRTQEARDSLANIADQTKKSEFEGDIKNLELAIRTFTKDIELIKTRKKQAQTSIQNAEIAVQALEEKEKLQNLP